MSNGWVLLGTRKVRSKLKRDDQDQPVLVYEWGITEGIAWPAFVRRMVNAARALGDSEAGLVRYARVRERQTRQIAVNYWKDEGYPWSEAMMICLTV